MLHAIFFKIKEDNEIMFCRFCGREINDNPQYCPWCGQKLDEGSEQLGSEQNMYSDNNAQNEKGNWRSYITPENIERYAPVAALAPVVLTVMVLIMLVLDKVASVAYLVIYNWFGYMRYRPGDLLIRLMGFLVIILCILVLAATAGLVYVAIKKKETSNVWVWVAPVTTFLAFISCCAIFILPTLIGWGLSIVCCVIGLEMIARITFSGQPMESPVDFRAAFATYKAAYDDYKSKYPTTKDLERTGIADPEKSYFDGNGFELLGYVLLTVLVSGITCGIAAPWMICKIYRWRLSHTVINGRRFTFDGTGAGLLGHWIIWEILTVITCGIFAFFAHVALRKWELSHTYIDGEPVVPGANNSYFDGNSFQYFGYGLLGGLFIALTCGLATPWVVCMLQKWDTKHQVVNARRLVFSGSGLGFLGEFIIIALLTLITCGIYLPWGVVRQNKYITRHTDFV